MEVFDIADMFGRRRRPMLVLIWRVSLEQSPDDQRVFKWSLILGLSNEGRALARYPMLDLVCPLEAAPDTRYGLDGNGREGLSRRPTVVIQAGHAQLEISDFSGGLPGYRARASARLQ